MSISASDVKSLRDQTGAGMMDCKKALTESNGDITKAIEFLRKRGQKLAGKRADREAKEGVVIAKTTANRNNGIILKLSCETDFVSKTESFVKLAESFAEIALKSLPDSTEALLATEYQSGLSIHEKITEQVGVIGEKLELLDYSKIVTAAGEGQVIPYIHMGYKAGVIVAFNLEGADKVDPGRDVAMQIAAMHPVAIDKDGVDAKTIESEIEIGKEVARKEGKPEELLEKIAMGKLNKFYKEKTLLNQAFVKDGKQSVRDYLQGIDPNLTVTAFNHVALG